MYLLVAFLVSVKNKKFNLPASVPTSWCPSSRPGRLHSFQSLKSFYPSVVVVGVVLNVYIIVYKWIKITIKKKLINSWHTVTLSLYLLSNCCVYSSHLVERVFMWRSAVAYAFVACALLELRHA